ncbi:hypothetical protein L218DRAFT_959753 [Marasmius fiardii PR-910]|nr:hypothetical protein L218DRAFT_959753 [Marasmius fiardii PR-910]
MSLLSLQAAVNLAFQEFPKELDGISPHRVTFTIADRLKTNGDPLRIRISENAWAAVVKGLCKGAILDVNVAPVDESESDRKVECTAPPQYPGSPGGTASGPSTSTKARTFTLSSDPPDSTRRSRLRWLCFLR